MVIIVGGGPAGLALGHRLQQHGTPYLILERATLGASWRNHYPGLRLHTLKELSHLPGLTYPVAVPTFPGRTDFLNHLEQYARHFDLHIAEGVEVQHAVWQSSSARWQLTTTGRSYETPLLVAATGIWSKPYVPQLPGAADFGGPVMHANSYQRPDAWYGRRVLVVGAGNTAADIATELAAAGIATGVLVRSGTQFVPYPRSVRLMRFVAWLSRVAPARLVDALLQPFRPDFRAIGLPQSPLPPTRAYPVVGYKLPEAVAAGKVTVHQGDIARLAADAVHFTDGTTAAYDALILATGYRPALDILPGSALQFDAEGHVQHDPQFRSARHARLFLVGYDYPATAGWIHNLARVARTAGDTIAADYALACAG